MSDLAVNTPKKKRSEKKKNLGISIESDPSLARNTTDPGDATGRNFRYQHAYGVMLIAAAKKGSRPYVALWCEHHEDFLVQRDDGIFDGYQIKTSRSELGPWKLTDGELTKSIGRFIDLVAEFGDRIGQLFFVSNKEYDEITPASKDERRRARCPRLFLKHIHSCESKNDIKPPYLNAFEELTATCSCEPDQLFTVLKRMDLIIGPSRTEFDAALSHEHLARLDDCCEFNAQQLDDLRDDLVAIVSRASSLQVTDPIRHLWSLVSSQDTDPILAAKKIMVDEISLTKQQKGTKPAFHFPGAPTIDLNAKTPDSVLNQKFKAGALEDDIEYMHERALAAEYNLLEDVGRRPEAYPNLLRQIEQRVHGELSEAHLRARQQQPPYGPAMLIDAQDRLRRLANDCPEDVGYHSYECLIGVAGLLTGECRIWWSPRFPISVEAV